jgi:hypothetical protein
MEVLKESKAEKLLSTPKSHYEAIGKKSEIRESSPSPLYYCEQIADNQFMYMDTSYPS